MSMPTHQLAYMQLGFEIVSWPGSLWHVIPEIPVGAIAAARTLCGEDVPAGFAQRVWETPRADICKHCTRARIARLLPRAAKTMRRIA